MVTRVLWRRNDAGRAIDHPTGLVSDGCRSERRKPRDAASMMRDETCLRRQWTLLRALSSGHSGLSIRQMAAELGVTERTIRRDLDVFRSVGFPLEENVG